ncbi:MAG TPA: sigma-E processing peptidase SpoIIGA [Thermoanaerobacterales bacterium]|nr:sigma-E processing peptidase SpoIIGA [Thermoanaerobacterales bacterium]
MVVYLDVVFLINLIMNFLILLFVAIVLNLKKNYFRILLGAAGGCLFLLSIALPNFTVFQSLFCKIALSAAMIVASFQPRCFKDFIKILSFFYLISFMVGGGAFALFYFYNLKDTFMNSMLLINNISVPWWILLVSSLTLFLFFKYLWPLVYRIISKDVLLVPMTVTFDEKSLEVKALIDTGNDLHDPISDCPVVIVEFDAVKDFFSTDLQAVLMKETEENLKHMGELISGSKWATRFRLIPFESIGKSKGLMIGFKPDMITLSFNNKILEIKDVILGIHQRILSPDGTYRALLNPDLLNE